jgi:hypothetical protein
MWQLIKASLTKTAFSVRLRSLLVLQVPDCFKVDGIASRTVRKMLANPFVGTSS